ncbi:MAG: type II toxin-antitoxin system PemK/MazF family toxin [Candidatus Magasanikbacteria bacterium]|nr:type II toxin-antitoxin system PemK/MazF family toxin [Candidatus Magasanikbacteria bacterium]
MYQKEFDKWNLQKKRLNQFNHERDFYYYEREVWWCALGVNIGIETDGKHEYFERPVLILKRFNNSMLWALPLTSEAHDDGFHFCIQLEGKISWVKLTQLKTIDVKRLLRKIGTVDIQDFEVIQSMLCGYIKRNPPLWRESRRPKPIIN